MKNRLTFNRNFYKLNEFYLGIASILLGIGMFFVGNNDTGIYLDYPHAIFGGLILIGCLMIGKSIFLVQYASGKKQIKPFTAREIIILIIMLFTQKLMLVLGSYTAIFLICLAISLLINDNWSLKSAAIIVLYNVVLIAICYICFTVFFGSQLPEGIFI